ncbi:PAS domain S-box protein [candidate division KSB1 bacterium]|nr:PAS domain S-box protein [candidate division KSB1 bacterium]
MNKIQLLIVEDERLVSEDLRRCLEKLDYHIAGIASSGEEALQKAEEQKPDLVLMDIILRGKMNGIEAANRIRSCFNIPIVYLTAYTDTDTLTRAKVTEPYGYIVKPFDERDLYCTIEMALYKDKIEKKAKSSEQWFSTTLTSLSEAVITTDTNGSITFMNPVAEALTGWIHQDALGKNFKEVFQIVTDDKRTPVEDPVSIALKERSSVGFTNRSLLFTQDGTKTPIEDAASPIIDSKGNILGVVVIFRDISERRQTELELTEREQNFRALASNANDGILIAAGEGCHVFANQKACKITGYSAEELMKISIKDLSHPSEHPKLLKRFRQRIKGEKPPTYYETRIIHKDGHVVPIELTAAKTTWHSQPADLVIIRDITKRKQADNEIRKLTQFLNLVIDSANLWLCTIDENANILIWNRAAEANSGYLRDEVVGSNKIWQWLYPDKIYRTEIMRKIADMNQGRASFEEFQTTICTKSGERKMLYWSVKHLSGEKNDIMGVVMVGRDITEEKRLERQLMQSQKMEAVGRLAGGIAHDFNNLLTAILGNTELMLFDMAAGEPMRPDLEQIKRAAERAASLTKQLLAYSRKQPLQQKLIDISMIVENMQEMLKRIIGDDIKIILLLEKKLHRVKADPVQLEQILMNLVINARDAMPEGGTLYIKSKNALIDKNYCKYFMFARPGKFVCLSVQDTGIGMDNPIKEQIFEPFFTTKAAGVGTGLGLSVVYGIIKQHQGWITVDSEPGEGSVFNIYLPAFEIEQQLESEKLSVIKEVKGDGKRILIVEDDQVVRDYMLRALDENGYIVFAAENSEEAIRIFNSQKKNIDLIFCDVVLPDIDGMCLAEQLLAEKPGMKVLLCSGFTDEKSRWKNIRETGFPFLQKPYTLNELLTIIKDIFEPEALRVLPC